MFSIVNDYSKRNIIYSEIKNWGKWMIIYQLCFLVIHIMYILGADLFFKPFSIQNNWMNLCVGFKTVILY